MATGQARECQAGPKPSLIPGPGTGGWLQAWLLPHTTSLNSAACVGQPHHTGFPLQQDASATTSPLASMSPRPMLQASLGGCQHPELLQGPPPSLLPPQGPPGPTALTSPSLGTPGAHCPHLSLLRAHHLSTPCSDNPQLSQGHHAHQGSPMLLLAATASAVLPLAAGRHKTLPATTPLYHRGLCPQGSRGLRWVPAQPPPEGQPPPSVPSRPPYWHPGRLFTALNTSPLGGQPCGPSSLPATGGQRAAPS